MNDMIKRQLNHRTIREFKDQEIPIEVFNTLIDVAQRTATSTGMQQYSIIRVTDPTLKKEIAKICNQEYVARAPELLIFIVDTYRNHRIALEQGLDSKNSGDMDKFFQGFTDATIAAQNMVNAAEAMDLGVVYLGSILNDIWSLCDLLELPQYTFPAVGLGIGYPNQSPQLKPRMDMKLRVFENKYEKMDNYMEKIEDYDKEMQTYYDLRQDNKPLDKFSLQVVGGLKKVITKRQEIVNAIVDQGYNLNLKKD
jgi:nitroreductase